MELVLAFSEIDRSLLPIVGGKAGNLGEMASAGLPVPPGFCLTTEAYRIVADSAGIKEIIEAIETTSSTDVATLATLAGRVRQALLAAPIPPSIAESIFRGYRGSLPPNTPVAVRSSATAEDLPFASFAGQQDTFLNIVGE